jgi:cysteinyl-tRNA synthetase
MINLTNTLTGKKESITKDTITFYACGVTPYDYAHVGHGRCYILFDVLYRFLRSQNKKVIYCRNFTDIDDKLLARAEKELGDKLRYKEIAEKFIGAYLEDMESLNCLFPDHQPRVTEVIEDIIKFIQGLIQKGHAYEIDGDVYFSVKSFKDYGKLSNRNVDDLKSGARVEVNEKKKDPLDFALWKVEPEGQFWKSPWGYGRPGWHIECSVMAQKFLGNTIDLHSGGMDLIFPHHENERAQSEALTGKCFSKHWMHVAFVRVNKEKMSKSLNNFFTLRDIFEKFDPMVVRFYILKHHYKTPLDFTYEDLASAEKAYRKLCKAFTNKKCPVNLASKCSVEVPVLCKMIEFLQDDLNTVGALGVVFEHLDTLGSELCVVKAFLQNIFGLTLEQLPEKIVPLTPEIEKLLDEREAARAEKDWKKADKLRDQLEAMGVEVQDKKL